MAENKKNNAEKNSFSGVKMVSAIWNQQQTKMFNYVFIGVCYVLLHKVNWCNGVGDDVARQSEESRSVWLSELISVVQVIKMVFKTPMDIHMHHKILDISFRKRSYPFELVIKFLAICNYDFLIDTKNN